MKLLHPRHFWISVREKTFREWVAWANRNKNILFFVGGFIFDALTITRIDSLADLLIQGTYLSGLTILLVYQYRENAGLWQAPGWLSKIWSFNVEILHFLYGGLLSAYVILYSKSSSGVRSMVFFVMLAFLLVINEMPQVRRVGYRLRLGLYAFCLVSFLIYLYPIIFGFMNVWLFALSVLSAVFGVWGITWFLTRRGEDRRRERIFLFMPAFTMLVLMVVFYFLRLIPPVPLSVKYAGIFHDVSRENGAYILKYPKPPFYLFWRESSEPFLARPGDSVFYFARIFAPKGFHHEVQVHWEKWNPAREEWETTDLVPLQVSGGREDGFRGYTRKDHYGPGKWRVTAETQDGRAIGAEEFELIADLESTPRKWSSLHY